MNSPKDRAQVAAPAHWWQRMTRPVVAQRIAPPLPDGVTSELLRRYEVEITDLAISRHDHPWEHVGPRSAVLHAQILIDDLWQRTPTEDDARPAKSARHMDINTATFAEEVVDDLCDSMIMEATNLPIMMQPMRPEASWITTTRRQIQQVYTALSLARKAHLDYVRHTAPERCCLSINIRYPAHWGTAHNFYVRQLVPILAGIVGGELDLPAQALAECIADPFADVQPAIGQATWGFSIRNDDPLEDREVAAA